MKKEVFCIIKTSWKMSESYSYQNKEFCWFSFRSFLLFSHLVLSDFLWPHHLIFCCPLLLWLQYFPASGSFPMSQQFASGGQSIWASTSASVLPMDIQDWSPLRWTGWISLLSKRLSRFFSSTTVKKHQFFGTQSFLWSNSYIHTWLLENYSFG